MNWKRSRIRLSQPQPLHRNPGQRRSGLLQNPSRHHHPNQGSGQQFAQGGPADLRGQVRLAQIAQQASQSPSHHPDPRSARQRGQQAAAQFGIVQASQRDHAPLMQEHGDGQGLQGDPQVGGDGQPHRSIPAIEQPIDGYGDQSDRSCGDHWNQSVTGGIKGTGVDSLRRPQEQREGEDNKVGGALAAVSCREAPSEVDQLNQRRGQSSHGRSRQQSQGGYAGNGVGDSSREFVVALAI